MNKRFTYKELSIVLGILVAVLVVITLVTIPSIPAHALGLSLPEKPALAQTMLKVVFDILF